MTTQLSDTWVLRVTHYDGPADWSWAFLDPDGSMVADHRVRLDPNSDEYEAFARLERFLALNTDALNTDQSRPADSEAKILENVGRWIGQHVFGPLGPLIVAEAPVTVEVRVPLAAREVLFRPLELAVVGELPLARQDVSLIMVVEDDQAAARGRKRPVGSALRVLAVFSLPDGEPALALRRQRKALQERIEEISNRSGKAIELRIVHYAATRARLAAAVEDGDGWDVVHFSGHGCLDGVFLEQPGGGRDPAGALELVDLLRPIRHRLKLLVLSSCASGDTPSSGRLLADHLGGAKDEAYLVAGDATRPLEPVAAAAADGASDHGGSPGGAAAADDAADGWRVPVLAEETVRRLDCAVLAMRYDVEEEFSIAFAAGLYDRLLGRGQPLPDALRGALRDSLGPEPTASLDAGSASGLAPLSVANPALFGARCTDLRLVPPDGPSPTFATDRAKTAGFPPEPEVFVGRAGILNRATHVLFPDNTDGFNPNAPVVMMLVGPAGVGTTATALEISYRLEDCFAALVWFQVPASVRLDELFRQFTTALDRQLPALRMAEQTRTANEVDAFLPRLRTVLGRSAVLIVIDGIDALLTESGGWRDLYWAQFVAAASGHRGASRLLLTGRRAPHDLRPGGPAARRIVVEYLAELSPQERELADRQRAESQRASRWHLKNGHPSSSPPPAPGRPVVSGPTTGTLAETSGSATLSAVMPSAVTPADVPLGVRPSVSTTGQPEPGDGSTPEDITLTPEEIQILVGVLAAIYGSDVAAAPLLERVGLSRAQRVGFQGLRPVDVWWQIVADLTDGRVATPLRRLVDAALHDYPKNATLLDLAAHHGLRPLE